MMEVTAYAVVPAPPDRVWELVCDTSRYAEWVEGTDEVTRTDGPAAPESTYDEVNPILGPWKANRTGPSRSSRRRAARCTAEPACRCPRSST